MKKLGCHRRAHRRLYDLVEGRPLQHGVSVTDACISFEQTVPVLQGLAAAVRARRALLRGQG